MTPSSSDETQPLRPQPPHARAIAAAEQPREIGPYKILETLGEGGMGIVYLAEQTKPIHRRVALKIIKLGMDTKQVIARFETEREALALMNHPNVAKVFDAGVSEQGRPYFVMEYVAGIPITDYCDKHRLNTEERLVLFMDVCHAIQHAHQKGIIHRDIKPSNVLVSAATEPRSHEAPRRKGGAGVSSAVAGAEVKVIDFGVAKATQHRLTEKTLFTEQGQLIGTPGYMSPEQAEMTALDIDTRTDIYSLGVLLYELLVGAMPFDTKTLLAAGFAEIQRVIREIDPPKPSTKFSSLGDDSTAIAHQRHTEPRALARLLRGDLDWIIMRAMEKDRARRYDTANGLALEVQRYLNHEPVLAGPPSASYRLRKFIRRNRASVGALAAVFVVTLTGAIVSLRMYFRAESERSEKVVERDQALEAEAEAQNLRREAEDITKFLRDMLSNVDPEQALGRDVTVRDVLDQAAKQIDGGTLDRQPLVEAALRTTIGEAYRALGLYDAAERHLRSALAIRKTNLDEKHPSVGVTSLALGMLLIDKGDPQGAQPFIDQGIQRQPDARGGQPASTLNIEAAAAMTRGDLDHSEKLYRQDLALRTADHGPAHVEVADAKYNLGDVLCRRGQWEEAERLYTEALDIRRRNLDPNHPDIADSLLALGDLFAKTGRPAPAESLLREALQFRKVLKTHWKIALTEATLGECLTALGRYAEAEPLLLSSHAEISRVQGADNVLYTRECASAIVKLYGSWDAAEPGKGYAEKAAQWRAKLDAMQPPKSQNPQSPN